MSSIASTRYWFDTEFDERGPDIQLISIGIVAEDGRTYHAASADYDDSGANDWLRAHVLPPLATIERKSRARIRQEVLTFLDPAPSEIWAYFGEYDWIVLRQLIGHMLDWPAGWPLSHMNLEQLRLHLGGPALPPHGGTEHNALDDALWCREAWQLLTRRGTACS